MAHQNLYIVDNSSEDQSVKKYLTEWCSVSKQMDIATGYLEIGGLLTLDTHWQKLDKIRIILGNEVTKRTKDVIDAAVAAILNKLKNSVDHEQEHNEFLIGVPAILDALKSGKIECRVYDKSKFHAKAYITYFRDEYRNQFIQAMNIPAGYALVGSSNFTKAGLTQNIELNVQVKDDVEQLQDWFEAHWEDGIDITDAILQVIENHCKEFSPYDVYLRSMYEYFKSREETVSEWENHDSVIYKGLSQYQRDGYNSMVEIANKYSGAFLCDGVQPLVDGQRWGIFCVEFDSDKFEVTALRKILSGLVPKRRNSADHAVWDQKDLMFICNWGKDNNRTIGIAHFEDKDSGLPQIKMISCAPAMEDFTQIKVFEDRLAQLAFPRNTRDIDAWRESWASAFVSG